MIVKLVKKPDVTELAGEKVMVDFDSGNYFMLKGSANAIWDKMYDGVDTQEIVRQLLEEYEVEESECRSSTESFFYKLEEMGFVQLVK